MARLAVWFDPLDIEWLADPLAGTDGDSDEERDRIGPGQREGSAGAHRTPDARQLGCLPRSADSTTLTNARVLEELDRHG